ncbi:disabled homolog 1-like [Oscarella lobularis]|uniref:disabled homolog 1-like n=1 Tax=Oscarella lobularis TaxID=121494 RepID=UPI003313D04C
MATFGRRTGSRGDPPEARFLHEGMDFKAKILGETPVPAARGERMCYDALKTLKSRVRLTGKHKQRIVINISTDGVKVREEKTEEELQHHRIAQISFVSHDPTDSRAFALICGSEPTGYTLHGFKTEKNASSVTGTIKELFQLVYKYKREVTRKQVNENQDQSPAASVPQQQTASPQSQPPPPQPPPPFATTAASPSVTENHSRRNMDESTNEDIFSDLATIRAQAAQKKTEQQQQQGQQQQQQQPTNPSPFDAVFHTTDNRQKADLGLIASLGDELFGESLYQVPTNKAASANVFGGFNSGTQQSSSINDWNEVAADLDQIAKELEPKKSNTPPFPLSNVVSDPFAPAASNQPASFNSFSATTTKTTASDAFGSASSFGGTNFGGSSQTAADPFSDPFGAPVPKEATTSGSGEDPFAVSTASSAPPKASNDSKGPRQSNDDRFAALRALADEDVKLGYDPFASSTDPFESTRIETKTTTDPFAVSSSTTKTATTKATADPFGSSSFGPQPSVSSASSVNDPFAAFAVMSPAQPNAGSTPAPATAATAAFAPPSFATPSDPFSDPFSSQSATTTTTTTTSDPFASVKPSSAGNVTSAFDFASSQSSADPFASQTSQVKRASTGNDAAAAAAAVKPTTDPFASVSAQANNQINQSSSLESDPFAAFDSPAQVRRPTASSATNDPFSTLNASTNPFASGSAATTALSPVNPFAQYQQSSPSNPFASPSSSAFGFG